jgi:hypothetical protein
MRKGSLSFSTALAGMTAPRPDIGWTTVPLFTSGRSDWGKSFLPLKGESFREPFLQCTSLQVALNDRPPFSGRPSLTGHCGHGWTCSLPRPVAHDPQETSATGLRIVAPKLFKPSSSVLDCAATVLVPSLGGSNEKA